MNKIIIGFSLLGSMCVSCSNAQKKDMPDVLSSDSVEQESLLKREVRINKPLTEEERNKCFLVISKTKLSLSVYEAIEDDTICLASYPVCIGKNKGNKEKSGDMKTPESSLESPLRITAIQDAHSWTHDFGDGRGAILSYGNWFFRLSTPGHSGIGIHGSTNNEESVPGRGSEGCIRLKDSDIIHLKENFAIVGMPVVVKSENQSDYYFEIE